LILVIRHEFYLTDEQIEASDDDPVVEINEYGVDADDEDELDSEKWQDQQTETLLRVFKKFKPDPSGVLSGQYWC
jgi:hypothetical protein